MTRQVLLNNIAHKDLRVITRHAAEFGDNVATVMTVPTEFADMQREYPIFFRKDANTGEFMSIALLGFAKGENLFVDEHGWNASYIPGVIARGPFFIGFQERESGGDLQKEAVIHVDMDDPRVSKTEGEPVFLPQGGNSRYLDRVAAILNGISQGLSVSKGMFAAFADAELIEPVKVEITFNSQEQYNLLGLHTINQKKLANLDAETLHKLHKSGFLQGAFLVALSLNNVQRLIELKGRRLQRQAATAS
ncbi:MAG: SapC family protein [Pseudomonadota bacterium]